ncbi:RrF2 family transcriptional regulator [Lacipirellula sp.]|uniref:RrF2 family transcriptional regulator n=1 Tax=Lacipirellula sp. TaxID=2691419 RepID=UPI003D0C1DE6
MFSQTVEYALRAMVQLAADSSGSATTKDIAAKAKVPSAYLAKVLQSMRRGGLIHSRRGVGGGVTLAKPAAKISLLDVIDAVEPLKRQPNKKVATANTLQKSMDTAVDQLRSKFASESLADMIPKGKGVKPAPVKRAVAKKR